MRRTRDHVEAAPAPAPAPASAPSRTRWVLARLAAGVLAAALAGTCRDDRIPTSPAAAPPPRPVVTAPDTGAILVGAGEVARCNGTKDEATALLLDSIAGTVFTTGDNVRASGALADFTRCYAPSWGRHKARTRPAVGALEYQTAGAAGYFDYFGSAAGERSKGYYSYDLGAWHVVVLNSNIAMGAGSAQEQWLRADLAANTKGCTLAYWQHPRFSSYSTAVRAAVKPLWDALYEAGAEVVLNGHYRLYERFAPQTPEEVADLDYGIRQFTVGTAGQGVNEFGTTVRPNSEVRLSGVYGVLKLVLRDGTYAWQFVPVAGQTAADSGSGTCHGGPGAPVASVTVSPAAVSLYMGQSVQLAATLKDASGKVLTGRTVTWSSGDTATATVDGTGLVTGKTAGSVTITGAGGGQSGTVAVTVTVPERLTADFTSSCSALNCSFANLSTGPARFASFTWEFGDGTTGTVPGPSHTYSAAGTYTVRLTVTDDRGATASTSKSVTVAPPFNPAAFTFSCSGLACTFTDQSAAPGGGRVVAWLWDFGDATTSTSQNPSHTYSAAGNYTVGLTVTSDSGKTASTSQSFPVPYRPPDAVFGFSCSGRSCTFSDYSRDLDGYIVARNWSFGDGTTSTSQNPSHSYGADGTYTIQLTVTDNSRDTASTSKSLLITAANGGQQLPVPDFQFGCSGLTCWFYDYGNGYGNADRNWSFGDGDTLVTFGVAQTTWHTYAAAGTYTVRLTYSGASPSESRSLTVPPSRDQPPNAAFTLACTGLSCSFTDGSTDPDGRVVRWSWAFGDGGTSSLQNPSHTYGADGIYELRLAVTDDSGKTAGTGKVMSIGPVDLPPIAGVTWSCNGLTCNFADRSSDPDGRVVAWRWDFGDGWTATSQNPSHTYAATGLYHPYLTVTDDRGATASADPWAEVGPLRLIDFSATCTAYYCRFAPSGPLALWNYDSRHWDFGDGGGCGGNDLGHGFFRDGEHWFCGPGTYTVTLTDPCCYDPGETSPVRVSKSVTVGNGLALTPTGFDAAAAATVDGVIYAIGSDAVTVEAYDPGTNTWTAKAPMPTPQWRVATAVVNGVIYAIGGAVEAYDPGTNTWTTKAPVPTPGGALAAAAVNGVIYAVRDDGALEAYDPVTDTWTARAPRPAPGLLAAAAVNGVLYTIGGTVEGYEGDGTPLGVIGAKVEAYDPVTDTWTEKAPMPIVTDLSVATVNGVLYVFTYSCSGGTGPEDCGPVAMRYDPSTNTWAGVAPIPGQRANFAVAAARGGIYAIGGNHFWWQPKSQSWYSSIDRYVQLYDPVTNTWR